MKKVVESDILSILYFLEEVGNIERWTGWEERKDVIQKEIPELIKCLDELALAKRMLQLVLDSLKNKEWPWEEED